MFQTPTPTKTPLFTFHPSLSERPVGLVSIPHSGEDVPAEFLPFLAQGLDVMREDVDFKVDELVDIPKLQAHGIGVLVAHVHRVCVDLNRDAQNSVLFWKENTKGVPLIKKLPSIEESTDFIARYHAPFFEIYTALLKELERMLPGPVPVVDLHSMPSAPTAYHMKQNPKQATHRADFCLSDQRGKTCAPAFIGHFARGLRDHGYEVAINDPYIGGYVTTFVDRFRTNNIQIEINRGIYMDEGKKVLVPAKSDALKPHLTDVLIDGLSAFAR
jgi:N-formylglutamate amidohydrolase